MVPPRSVLRTLLTPLILTLLMMCQGTAGAAASSSPSSSWAACGSFPRPSCPAYTACASQLCACTGVAPIATPTPSPSNATRRLRRYSTARRQVSTLGNSSIVDLTAFGCSITHRQHTCDSARVCVSAFESCVRDVAAVTSVTVDGTCHTWAVDRSVSLLQASLAGYNGSALQLECETAACAFANVTGLSEACLGTWRPDAATQARWCPRAPSVQPVLTARMRIIGDGFARMLADDASKQQLSQSLRRDLAVLLRVPLHVVFIVNLTIGSLVVNFAVTDSDAATRAELEQRVAAGSSSALWLVSTTIAYRALGGASPSLILETIRITTNATAGDAGQPNATSAETPAPPPDLTVAPPRTSGVPALKLSAATGLADRTVLLWVGAAAIAALALAA